jgi:hypothetical protein
MQSKKGNKYYCKKCKKYVLAYYDSIEMELHCIECDYYVG